MRDEIFEIENLDRGRIVTQFVDDEIIVRCGNRTVGVVEHIVTACNSFAATREALRELLQEAEFVADAKAPFSTYVAEKCRAALALAEEEKDADTPLIHHGGRTEDSYDRERVPEHVRTSQRRERQ